MHEHLTLLQHYVEHTGNEAVSCGLGYSAGMWGASVDCPAARDFHVETDDCACESARGGSPDEALRALVDKLGLAAERTDEEDV